MPFGGALSLGIGAGSSLLSGVFGGKAAKKAAQQQAQAQQKVIDTTGTAVADAKTGIDAGTRGVSDAVSSGLSRLDTRTGDANATLDTSRDQQLALLKPYIDSGAISLDSLKALSGEGGPLANKFSFDPKDLSSDPGYKFTLDQGQQAIQRAAAAQGGLYSTGTLKSLSGYTTGTANQYFNDAYNRARSTFDENRQNTLSRISTLQGLAGMGANATNAGAGAISSTSAGKSGNLMTGGTFGANLGLQGAGMNLSGEEAKGNLGLQGARVIGDALTSQGNAQAAGTVGSTNSWLSALNNGNNSILSYLAMRKPSGGSPGATTTPNTGGWSDVGG